MPLDDALNDVDRIEYFSGTVEEILKAIHEDGVDLRSYLSWSACAHPGIVMRRLILLFRRLL